MLVIAASTSNIWAGGSGDPNLLVLSDPGAVRWVGLTRVQRKLLTLDRKISLILLFKEA